MQSAHLPGSPAHATHPAWEEAAVLELAQEEGDEERARHEHEGEKRRVGLPCECGRPTAGSFVPQGQGFANRFLLSAVCTWAAVERMLLEDLLKEESVSQGNPTRW